MTADPMAGFLLGGTKIPSLKYDSAAKTEHTLTITDEPELKDQTDYDTGEVLTWNDGSPRKHLVVTGTVDESERIDAEDELLRREYIKGDKQKAVGQACRDAGVKALEVGGILWIKCLGEEKIAGTKKSKKLYKAAYKPPQVKAAAQASFLGSNAGDDSAPPFAHAFANARPHGRFEMPC